MNKNSISKLEEVLGKNFYSHDPDFNAELLKALKKKTGNDNIGILLTYLSQSKTAQ